MEKVKSLLKDFLLPNYNEFSLFIMSFSFFMLMLVNNQFGKRVIELIFSGENLLVYIGMIIFIAGTLISSYHIFSNRKKNHFEKTAMIFFTILTNIATGMGVWVYMTHEGFNWLFIFPLLNLINAGSLIFMFKFGIVNKKKDFNENTTLLNVILGVILVSLIICLSHYTLNLYWAIIFSICIAYAGIIDDILKLFQKAPTKTK